MIARASTPRLAGMSSVNIIRREMSLAALRKMYRLKRKGPRMVI